MSWEDIGDVGATDDTALAGLDDALMDLNGSFTELEGFDALAGSVKITIPVVVGGGVAFGTAAALDYFIEEPETRVSVLPYKWLIGAGVSVLAGLAMYKFQGPTEGIVTIASGLVTSLAGWGMEKLREPTCKNGEELYDGKCVPKCVAPQVRQADGSCGAPAAEGYRGGLREYVIQKNPMPVYEGYRDYVIQKNPQPVYEGFGKYIDVRQPVAGLGTAVNPGVFG